MKKRTPFFDRAEEQMIRDYERGEFKPVKNQAEVKRIAMEAARRYLRKDARVNIRLSTADLDMLKRRAAEEGMPYQTLIVSILHNTSAASPARRQQAGAQSNVPEVCISASRDERSVGYTVHRGDRATLRRLSAMRKRTVPKMTTDEDVEKFLAHDLSDLDFAQFKPAQFEFRSKDAQLNMRVPKPLLDKVKARAKARGVPYTRLIRQLMEQAVARE